MNAGYSMEKPGKRLCSGFTLIELLVVIAIIALLLSILMPALNKVKEQARVIVCGSQLHQAGQAVYAYALDFNGYIPPFLDPNPSQPGKSIPGTSIGPGIYNGISYGVVVSEPYGWSTTGYLPNAEALICPGDRSENSKKSSKNREKGHFLGGRGGYMSYWYCFFTPLDPTEPSLGKIHRYRIGKSRPEAVITLDQGYWGDDPYTLANWSYAKYHLKGRNLLHLNTQVTFADGKRSHDMIEAAEVPDWCTESFYWVRMFSVLDYM